MSDLKPEIKLNPPFGAVSWYADFFKLAGRIKIDKVDKELLTTNNIVPSSNVNTVLGGLKFLGLIDEDGNATETMKGLGVVGAEYQRNFEKMVRPAYAILFDKLQNLEQCLADDVINCFRTDYKIAPSTAGQGARVFVFLAKTAGIKLSSSIEGLGVSLEKKKQTQPTERKNKTRKESKDSDKETQEPLPEETLARFTLKGTGYVDIKDEDTLEIAKAYLKLLSKKLGISENES